MRARVLVLAALTLAAMLLPTAGAGAQDAGPGEVVIDGLNGPQGVLVADGAIWAIDTGLGGDETIQILNTETGEMVDARYGQSAQVVRAGLDGSDRTVVANLASVAAEESGYGGARLFADGDRLYATVGEWAVPDASKPAGLAIIASIDADGSVTEIADTWAHELDVDPYPRGTGHSHPYGMALHPDGRLLYTDAGGNALMAVDVESGAIETVAVFEPLPGVFPRPDYDGEMLTDPVPTAVVVQDGRIFVSLLSGAPFVPGNAKVVEVGADGAVRDFATGLTMLTDLAAGPDGNLYATQFAIFGEQGPDPASGAVVQISPDGTSRPVLEGLAFVTAIDVTDEGDAYVAVGGVGPPGSGSIMKFAGLAGGGVGGGTTDELPTTGTETALLIVAATTALAAGAMLMRFRPRFG